jgi:hypothetical protein
MGSVQEFEGGEGDAREVYSTRSKIYSRAKMSDCNQLTTAKRKEK